MAGESGDFEQRPDASGEPHRAGQERALADLAAGRLEYQWLGSAGPVGHWIALELQRRFGVAMGPGFGVCFVDDDKRQFAADYNAAVKAELERRHGAGVLERLFEEARCASDLERHDARQKWLESHRPEHD